LVGVGRSVPVAGLALSERATLHGLSVFVGAFSLEAAQIVVAWDTFKRENVVEAIAGLVTKSLVTVETHRVGVLYRLLDTTRAYVLTKMADSDRGTHRGSAGSEVERDRPTWTIPADRMKAGREHRVPLTPRCIDVAAFVQKLQEGEPAIANLAFEFLISLYGRAAK
jgi:hypothetical protein